MSDAVEQPSGTLALPTSIWVVAWASLAGQLLILLWQGGRTDDELSVVGSMILGGLVVGYVAAGVVRARIVRVALAWVVLALSLIGELAALLSSDDPGQGAFVMLSLASTGLALGGLASFRRTGWYAWQRTKPPAPEGASIGQLVAIGVLVGVLGGLTGPVDNGFEVNVRVTGR